MPQFNIQYINNSKTLNDTIEASTHNDAISLFENLVNAEIVEVSEIVYQDKTYPKDDKNYQKGFKLFMVNDKGFNRTVKIPKVKLTIDDIKLKEFALNHLVMNNKPIHFLNIYNL